MNRFIALLCLTVVLVSASFAQETALKENDFVAICGDSITEQKMYSVFIEDYLLMCKPRPNLHAMQFGWGGEQARGFTGRMSNVLRFPVTVATTCYGMNDGGYAPLTPERAQTYRESQKAIVDTFKKSAVHLIVVGSPGAVDTKHFHKGDAGAAAMYNTTLAQLRDIAREVATQQGVAFADVYGPMMDVMAKAKAKLGEDYDVAGGDGVHPNRNGHLVMAYAFLKALGCDGSIGAITVDLAAGKAQATEGHKILSAVNGVIEIESTRYPFCFAEPTDPKVPASGTKQIIEFFPFNDELNRFKLIVNGAGEPARRVKVTWGAATKEYAAGDLAKGINLAAEFLDNPFSEPFKKVETAVLQQQQFESPLIKELLHNMPHFVQMLPEAKESWDKIVQTAMGKAKSLNDASSAAVTPVKYTIKVEVVGTPPAPAPPPAPPAPPAAAPASAPAVAAPAPAPATHPATAPAK